MYVGGEDSLIGYIVPRAYVLFFLDARLETNGPGHLCQELVWVRQPMTTFGPCTQNKNALSKQNPSNDR